MHSSKLLATSVALVLCLVIPISLAQNFPFPQSIVNYMATRSMRYHHYMWHQVRENWNRFSSSTQRMFRNINWAPPNPSRDGRGNQITNNFAGEDFLYMHRQMLGMARQYGSFSSWSTIPAPGDSTYPVPPMYGQKGSNDFKTNNYYYSRIQGEERTLKDPNYLRRISLNQLGTRIEAGIHNSMHMRWSAASSMGYRGEISANNGVPNVNRQWDNVRYNWLVDTYASQCNPYFYKLHGWIDDRVEDWRRANGLSSIMWRGTWTGGPLSSLGVLKEGANVDGMDMHDEEPGDVLVEAFNIFQKSGVPEFFIGDNGNTLPPNKRKTVKKCRKAPKKVKKI